MRGLVANEEVIVETRSKTETREDEANSCLQVLGGMRGFLVEYRKMGRGLYAGCSRTCLAVTQHWERGKGRRLRSSEISGDRQVLW